MDWTAYHCYTGWFDDANNEAWLLRWPAFAVDLAIAFAKGGECDPKDGPFVKEKAGYYDEAEPTKSQPMTINLVD